MDAKEQFRLKWGWKVTISEMSGDNPFFENEYYTWTWLRFLNEMAFRKERNSVKD